MAPPKPPLYHAVSLDREQLAGRAFDRFVTGKKALRKNFSPAQKARILEDLKDRISCLQESLAVDSPAIFLDYTRWAQYFTNF